MSFQDLNLHEEILKAIAELGYATPTPIQSQAIPKILAGFDLSASAQTGTGKTAAFILPTLNKLITPSPIRGYGPRALILVPTRELALQVAAETIKYSKYLSRMKTVCIYGGMPYPVQNRELSRPFEILVATPGRLIDHMERGRIDFSRLEILILDEADRMLDMGFIEPVEQIAAATPKGRQTLMFSATINGNILNLSRRLQNNPHEISVSAAKEKHENIEQRLYYVDNLGHKHSLLEHLLNDPLITQAIVFTATKFHADQLEQRLRDEGHLSAALHGDMSQRQRTRTITQMRQGSIRVLVATDVAARGIDVQTISHVINFDLPNSAEDYVHRIGRTGRAGSKGLALSFVAAQDRVTVRRIEQFTGQKIASHSVEGMEAKAQDTSVEPRRRGGPRSNQRSGPRSNQRSGPRSNQRSGPRSESGSNRFSSPKGRRPQA